MRALQRRLRTQRVAGPSATNNRFTLICSAVILSLSCACSAGPGDPVPGPDKQSQGTLYGAMLGAGSGAVSAAQLGAATGPGAWVGAGLGGIFGLASGIGLDIVEEDQVKRQEEVERLRTQAWVHEVLKEHYERRLALHPTRDIFPADLFFERDGPKLRREGKVLLQELARLTKQRTPWSRILVTSYVSAADPDSSFAGALNEERSETIGLHLIRCGVEPRRVVTQGVVMNGPLLIDPDDHPGRYRQAIEILPLDY